MFEGMKDMGAMMKLMGQAGKIKENMAAAQQRAKARTVDGEAGAGMVKVSANGAQEIVAVKIDAEALKDPETIGPMIVSAANLALAKSKEIMADELKTALGGIDLPPGMI